MTTLLVTGIHREERDFGDRVAALLDRDRIGVMRIPEGISHARTGTDGLFYYEARHREMYLQLRQQVKGRCRLLVDLHCGFNEAGRCADVYCREERMLRCVARQASLIGKSEQVRAVKILTDTEASNSAKHTRLSLAGARTSIPQQIWNDCSCCYVGLEIYLTEEGVGTAEDWRFARDLIETIQLCGLNKQGLVNDECYGD